MTSKVGLFVLLAAGCYAQQETATYSYNGLPLFIPVDSADVISVATIDVPRALSIANVTAKVQIDYPNSGDLNLYLYSPTGIRVKLLERNCNVSGVDTVFDDAAPQKFADFCPAEAGRGPFQGNEPLANMRSDPSSFGRWRLAVENNGSDSRTGWLTGFSLTITGNRQVTPVYAMETVVNAASRMGNVVAPGELMSVYGFSLGPTTAATAPAGALPTTLGGVTVTVNGTAVPIGYASLYRVDFQAPFALTSGAQATIRVTGPTGTGRDVMLPIVASAPGLFSVNPDGTGQLKAINQDGTVNALGRPAAKGTIISVYGSGLGALVPALTAGAVPPTSPLSVTAASVAASIGGAPARVVYAGVAPGIPGTYQVNIEVPAESGVGPQQLIISTNGSPSQNGATVMIN